MRVFIVMKDVDAMTEVADVFEKKSDAIDFITFNGFTKKQEGDVWLRPNYFRRSNSDLDLYYIEEKEVK
jgi:hypothetical protein